MSEKKSAEITTLSATVNQLTVNGRQVTSTLAKQLDVEYVSGVTYERDLWGEFDNGFLDDKERLAEFLVPQKEVTFIPFRTWLPETPKLSIKEFGDFDEGYAEWDEDYLNTLTYQEFKDLPHPMDYKKEMSEKWRQEMSAYFLRSRILDGKDGGKARAWAHSNARIIRKEEFNKYFSEENRKHKDLIKSGLEAWGRVRINYPKDRSHLNDYAQYIGVRKRDGALAVIVDKGSDGMNAVSEWSDLDLIVLGGIG